MKLFNMENVLVRYEFMAFILTLGLVSGIDNRQGFLLRDKGNHNTSKLRPGETDQQGMRIQPAEQEHTALPTPEVQADSDRIIPVIYDDKHCKNGGTGYLGSFCLCPPLISGRYCEIDLRNDTTCGALSHGEWTYRNCNICKCNNGILLCELFELKGCRDRHKQSNRGTQSGTTFSWILISLIMSIFISKFPSR